MGKKFFYRWFTLEFILRNQTNERFSYSANWHDKISRMTDRQFYEFFRMKKSTFENIVDKLYNNASGIHRSELKLQNFLFLGYACHKSTIRGLRELFVISKSTLHRKMNEISSFLFEISPLYIKLPSDEDFETLSASFLLRGRVTKTILAIDGTHIPIVAPPMNAESYYNRKGFYSLNFTVCCDADLIIRWISNDLGCAHDARVLRNSEQLVDFIFNLTDGFHLTGDKAYRGFANIWIPGVTSDINQENIDDSLDKQRIRIENCFGLLKGKFRKLDSAQKNGEKTSYHKIIVGCAVLHNLMIKYKRN